MPHCDMLALPSRVPLEICTVVLHKHRLYIKDEPQWLGVLCSLLLVFWLPPCFVNLLFCFFIGVKSNPRPPLFFFFVD